MRSALGKFADWSEAWLRSAAVSRALLKDDWFSFCATKFALAKLLPSRLMGPKSCDW